MIQTGRKIMDRIVPGFATAIVAFPLSIGLAVITGVPPEVMILASIYAAFFNVFFASSKYGVGGPNTAVALLTGVAIAPYAPPESNLYIGYVFALAIMIGVIQLFFSIILRKIDIMDYVSTTVIDGLTIGIGAIFVLKAINVAAGLAPDNVNQWIIFNAFTSLVLIGDNDANYFSLVTSSATVLAGIVCWQFKRIKKFAVPVAVLTGFVIGNYLDSIYLTRMEMVGSLDLKLFSTSLPDFRQVSWPTLFHLAGPAFAIALIGILQTLSIAKTIRNPGDKYIPSREIFSQGLQHVFLGFFNGAPVSNSFNKTAVMHRLGGDKWSLIISAVITALFVIGSSDIVAIIPMPALGGCLILVGLSMMNLAKHRVNLNSGKLRATILVVSMLSVIFFSIQEAIFIGTILSIGAHFVKFSQPVIEVFNEKHDTVIKVSGVLFFASGAKLNKQIHHKLDQFSQLSQASVYIDLTDAIIFPNDQIDVDWIASIVGRNIPVVIVCTEKQKDEMNLLRKRGGIPESCNIIYKQNWSLAMHKQRDEAA